PTPEKTSVDPTPLSGVGSTEIVDGSATEVRGALLLEGRHTLGEVGTAEQDELPLALAGEGVVEFGERCVVDRVLRRCEGHRRAVGESLHESLDGTVEFLVRVDVRDEPGGQCL